MLEEMTTEDTLQALPLLKNVAEQHITPPAAPPSLLGIAPLAR